MTFGPIIVNERSVAFYTAFFSDKTGAGILLADVTSLKITLFDKRSYPNGPTQTSESINSRYEQDVKNANNGTYASASGSITGASSASPIVATATAHGRVNGEFVHVKAVQGNDGANNDPMKSDHQWPISVVDANSFRLLGSRFTGAYTAATGTWTHSKFEWAMQPADNQIVNTGLSVGAFEEHVAIIEGVATGGVTLYHPVTILVRNMGVAVPF